VAGRALALPGVVARRQDGDEAVPQEQPDGELDLVCLSGRGDKDLAEVLDRSQPGAATPTEASRGG